MLAILIIILIILWLLGYVSIGGIFGLNNIVLFTINNHPVTLWEVLILIAVSWAISILPGPLRLILSFLLLLWILSTLGILAITGLASIIILVIILGLIISLFR